MTTKLHIDISQGIIEVEGEPELVRTVYADFKIHILEGLKFARPALAPAAVVTASHNEDQANSSGAKQKSRRRVAIKKKANQDEGGVNSPAADAPKLDKNLDISSLGAFYAQFAPKNNAEKVLIFLRFLTESLGIESPNTDQVYTCFKVTGQRIPKAFAKAFYDTSSKHGYIEFRSSSDLSITIVGDNHFSHTLKRRAAE